MKTTNHFLKLSPDSSTDTNEGNNGKKVIIKGQSPILSIVSANTTLIDKGKSNLHHQSISTKNPFHTISTISYQMTRIQISIQYYPIKS